MDAQVVASQNVIGSETLQELESRDTAGGQAAGQADHQLIDDCVSSRHRFIRDGGPAFGS